MKTFTTIINEAFNPDDPAVIESTPKIVTTKGEIAKINSIIKNYTDNVYSKFGYKYPMQNTDIIINKDLIIDCEFINKMVNNYTVFKFICNKNLLKTFNDFRDFISKYSNLEKYYHYNGVYNKEVLKILFYTIRKGRVGEIGSLWFFETEFNKKSTKGTITVISPSLDEDIKGIDGKFYFQGSEYTIQIKPYSNIVKDDNTINFLSIGSVSLSTDYLILYQKNKNIFNFYIFNSKYVRIRDNYFAYPINRNLENGSANLSPDTLERMRLRRDMIKI